MLSIGKNIDRILTAYNKHTYPPSVMEALTPGTEHWRSMIRNRALDNRVIVILSLASLVGTTFLLKTTPQVNLGVGLPNSPELRETIEKVNQLDLTNLKKASLGFFLVGKTPNWLKNIIYSLLLFTFFVLFKKYTGVGVEHYLLNALIWKYVFSIFIIYLLFIIFNTLFLLHICFSKTKKSFPKYTPNFISRHYNTIYDITRNEKKEFYIKLYLRTIFLGLISLIVSAIVLFIIL